MIEAGSEENSAPDRVRRLLSLKSIVFGLLWLALIAQAAWMVSRHTSMGAMWYPLTVFVGCLLLAATMGRVRWTATLLPDHRARVSGGCRRPLRLAWSTWDRWRCVGRLRQFHSVYHKVELVPASHFWPHNCRAGNHLRNCPRICDAAWDQGSQRRHRVGCPALSVRNHDDHRRTFAVYECRLPDVRGGLGVGHRECILAERGRFDGAAKTMIRTAPPPLWSRWGSQSRFPAAPSTVH